MYHNSFTQFDGHHVESFHFQILLWIKECPTIKEAPTEAEEAEVAAYVQAVATVALPNPVDSPGLAQLVEKFQRHKCRKTCSTNRKVQSKKDGQTMWRWKYVPCRYGYPKEPSPKFVLKTPKATVEALLKTACTHEVYTLPRGPDAIDINAYHPVILYLLQANMDVKVVKDEHGKLIYYVTKYVTKEEKDSKAKDVYEAVNKVNPNASLHSKVISTAMTYLKHMEMGQEAASDFLNGVPLLELSDKPDFMNVQPKAKRKQLLKGNLEKLQKIENPEATNAVWPGFWGNYPMRAKELEHVCAYDMERLYDRITEKEFMKRDATMEDRRRQNLLDGDAEEQEAREYFRCLPGVPDDEVFYNFERARPKVTPNLPLLPSLTYFYHNPCLPRSSSRGNSNWAPRRRRKKPSTASSSSSSHIETRTRTSSSAQMGAQTTAPTEKPLRRKRKPTCLYIP